MNSYASLKFSKTCPASHSKSRLLDTRKDIVTVKYGMASTGRGHIFQCALQLEINSFKCTHVARKKNTITQPQAIKKYAV